MDRGNIIATYYCKGVTVQIDDAALQRLTPEQIAANRREVQRVASRILDRAVERGAVEGLTPEDYRRRFGRKQHGDG